MKRIGAIISLSVLIVLLASTFSFATGLSLVESHPEDGADGFMTVNMAVKLKFSENMTSEEAQAANANKFKITNPEGKKIEYKTLYNAEKYPDEIWLQITENLVDATEYTIVISEDLQSTTGNTLGENITLHFSTRDTAADNNGYMILMVLMIVGMVVFTVWDTGRKLKKEAAKEEDQKVNPYKEAKKTGKSVEEIVAKTEKEKAQAEKRKAKANKKQSIKEKSDDEQDVREGVKRVKARKPISSIGAPTPKRVIEMREARESAKAEAEAKARAKAKNAQTSKSKGSKQQQRKKK